jgi:hypothetical protein
MLPALDVVLHERTLLCESRIDTYDLDDTKNQQPAVCTVLQLAARKAVGCGDDAAIEGTCRTVDETCATF